MARPPDSLHLDSSSDRMWALKPKPLPAEFPFQTTPIPPSGVFLQLQEARGSGMQISKGRRHSHTVTKGPLHIVFPTLGGLHTLPPLKSPLGSCPGLLHTLLWPKGFSLRISDIIAPNPGLQLHQALKLGHTQGLLTLPQHLYSQPGLFPLFTHRPGPSPFPAPQSWMWTCTRTYTQSVSRVLPAVSDQVCCCPWGQDQKPTAISERERQRLVGRWEKSFTNCINKTALEGA